MRNATYLGVGAGKELLKMLNTEIRNTDILHLSSPHQLLHLPPRINKIPILIMMRLVIEIRRARPMHQIQVHIVSAQVAQAVVNRLGHALVPRVVELGGQPDLVARHARRLDALADLLLVAVGKGGVDVAVAGAQRVLDGFGDFVGARLPGAQADGGDLVPCVEGVGFAGRALVSEWRG